MFRFHQKFKLPLLRLVAMLLFASLFSACMMGGRSPFARPSMWKVELHSLDQVAFHWKPGIIRREGAAQTFMIELLGNGYMTMASGVGAHVNDPFADARDGVAPIDERRDQIVISEAQTLKFFQKLVDTGFFDRDFGLSGGANHTGPTLLVYAKINGRKQMQATDDPALMALFEVLLDAF